MTTKRLIRNANLADYTQICTLFAQANAEHLAMRSDLYRSVTRPVKQSTYSLAVIARDVFGYEPVSLKVAEHQGQVVGVVFIQSVSRSALSWSAFEKEAYLDNVVVMPEMRCKGIGTQLVQSAIDWAKATGHAHVWGKIIAKNAPSQGLFLKAGFSVDSNNVGLHLL